MTIVLSEKTSGEGLFGLPHDDKKFPLTALVYLLSNIYVKE